MQKISESFRDNDGRSPLFTSVIWASEWEAYGFPPVNHLQRSIYCHLFCFGGSTGLSVSTIARITHGKGDHRKTIKRQLVVLEENKLAYEEDELWFALVPPKVCQSTQIPGQSPRCVNRPTVSIATGMAGSLTQMPGQSPHCVNRPTVLIDTPERVNRPTLPGQLTQIPGQSPHLQTIEKNKERTTTTKENDISEKRRERTKSDRIAVGGVDFQKFNPVEIFNAGHHWLQPDLQPPEDLRDRMDWLRFAANCQTWRRLNKPGAEALTSATAYASTCRSRFENDPQAGVEAIQSALEMAQSLSRKQEADAKSQKLRSQQAAPKFRKFSKDNPGPDDFLEWIAAESPEFDKRMRAFREFASGAKASFLAPHAKRLDNKIAKVRRQIEKATIQRVKWEIKCEATIKLNAMLNTAREDLDSA